MARPEIITGDGVLEYVTLTVNGSAIVGGISSGATVKVAIVSLDHKKKYTADITQSAATPGTDWPNSKLAIVMDPADTAGITYQGTALFEIQVTETGINPVTWFLPCKIIRGLVA
jgi:hypothetical protein